MAKAKSKASKASKSSKVKSALKGVDLASVLNDAEKGMKDSALVELDLDSLSNSMPHISTGSVALDYLIGGKENAQGVRPCPGIPRGRITNVYGLAGAGKTTIALQTAASVCNDEGGTCVYIDWENEVEPRYAQMLGVPVTDKSKFMLLQPETLEQGFKLMVKFASAGVDLIVVDSVGAGVPEKMFAKEAGEQAAVGLLARQWSQFLPLFKRVIADANTGVIGISQLREAIGGMGGFGSGPQRKPQGGQAWKYYSSLQIMLRVVGKDRGKEWDGLQNKMIETVKGNIVRATLDKCKVSDAYKHECQFYLMNGIGVDNERTVLDLAISVGVVKKGGAWYTWADPTTGSEHKGQGLDGFRKLLPDSWLDSMFNQVRGYLTSKKNEEEPEMKEEVSSNLGEDGQKAMDELDDLFK
jgi:recombination protein RecA